MRKVASAENCSNSSRNLKSGRINEKNRFFPFLDRFRALRESSVADQSCCNFLILVKLTPFDDRPDD